ncbi:ester cyclase [Piscinibacter sakaiensis]|uniref:ester cyclase n=1 Tax=Piscinibacter sakaiensis TaxID=1547922 RepID=UPI003AAE02C6
MDSSASETPQAAAERLARDFLERVWGGWPDLDAIDQLMSEDYELVSAGTSIRGRIAFKQWVADFQQRLSGARNEVTDVFASAAGDRVAARWICSGRSAGIFGLPADGRRLHFSGLSIWAVREGRLSRCWVERSAPIVDD